MTTKQLIAEGTQMLADYNSHLEKIELIEKLGDDKAAISFLLEIVKLDFQSKSLNVQKRLAEYQKQYAQEFEVQSAETNMHIQGAITEAEKWIGKEPKGITEKLPALIDSYKTDNLTQEMRNDIYFALKGHLNFLTNTYKKK